MPKLISPRLLVAFSFATILIFIVVSRISAATFCVNPTGSNGCYSSIQTAINAASSGDTINIDTGTFNESLSIMKDLTLQGNGANLTILDGQNSYPLVVVGQYGTCCGPYVGLKGVTIQHGYTAQFGGGVVNYGNLFITQSVITNNVAYAGAGIFSWGTLALNTVTVANNPASGYGGGIYSVGPLTLNKVIVDGNSARDSCCGGLAMNGGVVVNSTISNNSAFLGGGISGSAIINNSAIISNTASLEGGGIYNSGSMQLTNVTISGNHVVNNTAYVGGGGGLFNDNTATLTNVTIANNDAVFGGGGIQTGSGISFPSSPVTTTFKNSIVALNQLDTHYNCATWNALPMTSLGHNMDDSGFCWFDQPSDFPSTYVALLPLANNGGTTLTHALRRVSPAINAGDNNGCPATDQRGYARDAFCDIGAYEYVIFYYFPFVSR